MIMDSYRSTRDQAGLFEIAAAVVAGWFLWTGTTSGATLLLDFGSTTAYDGTNSPAHVDGAVANTYTDWKAIPAGTGGTGQVVQDSDNNHLTIYRGRNSDDNSPDYDKVDLDFSVYTVTDSAGTGIFATDLTNDALISHNNGWAQRDPIAALIQGLPQGEYEVYVVGHFAGNANAAFNVLAGAVVATVPDGTTSSSEIQNLYGVADSVALSGGNSTAWVEGVNYGKFTVHLTSAHPDLIIGSDGGQGSVSTHHITAAMITPVPEPGTLGLLAGAGLLALRRRRRSSLRRSDLSRSALHR